MCSWPSNDSFFFQLPCVQRASRLHELAGSWGKMTRASQLDRCEGRRLLSLSKSITAAAGLKCDIDD